MQPSDSRDTVLTVRVTPQRAAAFDKLAEGHGLTRSKMLGQLLDLGYAARTGPAPEAGPLVEERADVGQAADRVAFLMQVISGEVERLERGGEGDAAVLLVRGVAQSAHQWLCGHQPARSHMSELLEHLEDSVKTAPADERISMWTDILGFVSARSRAFADAVGVDRSRV